MSSLDQFDANLRMLDGVASHVAAALRKVGDHPQLIAVAADDWDLDLGNGRRLYGQGGRAFAEKQVALFMDNPFRVGVNRPRVGNIIGVNNTFLADMLTRLERKGGYRFGDRPRSDCGELIIVGVGLGYHVGMLIDRLRPRTVVLVEEYPEFVARAMRLHDWTPWMHPAGVGACTLNIMIAPMGEALGGGILKWGRDNAFAWDGTYIYQHMSSSVLDRAMLEVTKHGDKSATSDGYFEDELYMLQNGAANFTFYDLYVHKKIAKIGKNIPAFVVASGPSIDRDIENIKNIREKVVVISAGSGLGVCLNNGIRPDFHCELENEPSVPKLLSVYREKFGFHDIVLIAPQTVSPDAYGMFDKRIVIQRTGVTPERLYRLKGEDAAPALVPLVSNVAVSAAGYLGFEQIYLFGVDLGARNTQVQHSKSSAYYEVDYLKSVDIKYTMTLPGNFGGVIHSDKMYMWSQTNIEFIAKVCAGRAYYNCSGGAAIAGFAPMPSATIRLGANLADRRQVVAEILDRDIGLDRAGQRCSGRMPADILRAVMDLLDRIRGARAAALRPDGAVDAWGLANAISRMVNLETDDDGSAERAAMSILKGAVKTQMTIWHCFRNRLHPDCNMVEFDHIVLSCFSDSLDRIEDLFVRYTNELTDMLNAGVYRSVADAYYNESAVAAFDLLRAASDVGARIEAEAEPMPPMMGVS